MLICLRLRMILNCEIIMALSCDPSANGDVSSGNFFPLSMLATPNDASKVDAREIYTLTIKRWMDAGIQCFTKTI